VKPAAFEYLAPRSVEEVVALLAERGEDAKVIAGGQSLVPMMAFRLATPAALVDLNGVSELDHARVDRDTLVLGATARHRSVQELSGLREGCAMVAEAVDLIGHPAIRNRGTVGGSVAHADPAAEWPALLLALDGEVDAVGPAGRRTITAGELFQTYFTTALAPDEILTEVRLRLPTGRSAGSSFLEVAQRHGDFAVAGAGAVIVLEADGSVADARLVLIGVRDTAVRSVAAETILRGASPTDPVLDDAANAIGSEIDPVSDVHGSSAYRRRVAIAVARRALTLARDRAHAAVA
jgi:aerobic carbon-monoxide dehydrogenase medium subunit